jgi:sulfate-transporting ATPase
VVAITHDRYFLDNAAEWILELDRGAGIPWKGNYSDWLDQKEKRLEVEQKKEDARMKAMKEELKWVRSNAKARQTKSKARLARFEELSDVEYQRRNETNEIFIPVAERLGNEVIEFKASARASASAAHRQPQLQGAGRAPSSASSAPTAPASRRCSA